MSATRSRHRRSSAQPSRTQDQSQSQGRSRVHIPGPQARHRSRSRTQGHVRNQEEISPNTLTGRELSRALNKASERGTQGKEMCVLLYIYIRVYSNRFIDRTGPLAPYIRAGKLIPRLIDPWLDLDLVFTRGLTTDGLLTMTDSDNDDNDAEMDE